MPYYWRSPHPPPHPDDGYDGMREVIDGFRTINDSFYPGMYPEGYDYPVKYIGPSQQSMHERPMERNAGLTTRESVELFQEKVEEARRDLQQSLAGTEKASKAGEALRPKLTVDLSRQFINQIPKEVVGIVKQDVERLQLAHNQISLVANEFANCSALKYLNLRDNRLKEVPKAVLGLSQLEILDLSKNKLSDVPDEIENMKALRVFSIGHNNIQDLPFCLGSISTLRMLKLSGNPLNPSLKRIVEGNQDVLSPSLGLAKNENERDTILTRKVTEYLRTQAAAKDSGEDSSDGPLETPRAQSRFPVQPYAHSTSGSESASDLRSPGFIKPPVNARSHYRVPSSQSNALQNAALRRPGLAPLALGNERNRSNSESILQATQNNRNKRMGMVPKKNVDLATLDESRANRSSYHFRGQSHGSALRNGVRVGDVNPGNITGSRGGDRQQRMVVHRLSSVPEQKQDATTTDKIIESAKGVLYSLHLAYPQVLALCSVIKDGKSKRSSFERVFHNAALYIDHLDQELNTYDSLSGQDSEAKNKSKLAVAQVSHSCIQAHRPVVNILLQSAQQLVKDTDPRHMRTLMLLLYGSLNEISNASKSLGINGPQKQTQNDSIPQVQTITEVSNERHQLKQRDRSVTPTRERPQPERRWRNGSTAQQSNSHLNLNAAFGVPTAVPLYLNGRSRSNSRAGTLPSPASSSLVSTPRSGESFSGTTFVSRSRSSSITVTVEQSQRAQIEKEHVAQFEKIFLALSKAAEQGLQTIPHFEPHFLQCLNVSINNYAPEKIVELWNTLVNRTHYCIEMSEALKMRLSTVKLNDPEARNARDFWRLVKTFVDSYSNLMFSLREAKINNLVPNEMRQKMRPVYKSTSEVASLIANSPWNRLTFENESQMQLQPPLQTMHNRYTHHRSNGSGGSNATSGSSPYTASVPATPLSAALGPAAQATVPATPASASLDRSFEGDIFQRADALLSQSNTMIKRF